MPKKLFDLTDDDLATLERLRAKHGLRSHAETLRALIRGEVIPGLIEMPEPAQVVEITPLPKDAPRFIKGEIEPARSPSVPLAGTFERKPMQKTPKVKK